MRNGKKSLRWSIALVLLAAMLAGGCMRRRMTIRSDPPGAVVVVDGYELGTTPLTHDFTFYGDRNIRLIKDGYETLEVMQPVYGPWYQTPPLDFVTDNLWPGQIQDNRLFNYVLTPRRVESPAELRRRAEMLRQGTRSAAGISPMVIPASGTSVVGPASPSAPANVGPNIAPNMPMVPTPAAPPQEFQSQPGMVPQPAVVPSQGVPEVAPSSGAVPPPGSVPIYQVPNPTRPQSIPVQPPMNIPAGQPATGPAFGGSAVRSLPPRL